MGPVTTIRPMSIGEVLFRFTGLGPAPMVWAQSTTRGRAVTRWAARRMDRMAAWGPALGTTRPPEGTGVGRRRKAGMEEDRSAAPITPGQVQPPQLGRDIVPTLSGEARLPYAAISGRNPGT